MNTFLVNKHHFLHLFTICQPTCKKIKFTCFTCQMREMKKGGGVVRHMFRAHQKIEIKHHKNIGKTTLRFT